MAVLCLLTQIPDALCLLLSLCLQEHSTDDSAFGSRALTSVISSEAHSGSLGAGSSSAAAASGPQRMLETWIICELANAGNLQDAVMHHNGGAFFYQNMPHLVRGAAGEGVCSVGIRTCCLTV
jgi:hypothetical protein